MSVILFKRKSLLDKMLSAVKAVGGAAWYVPDDFLVLGPNILENGDFSQGSAGWNPVAATFSVANGEATVTATSTASPQIYKSFPAVPGRSYLLSFEARNISATDVRLYAGGILATSSSTTWTPMRGVINAGSASSNLICLLSASAAGQQGAFRNVEVREIISAKDFQYTSGETPSYLGGSVGLMYDALAQLGADKNTLPYSGWSKPTGVTTDGDSLILADFSTSLSTYGMIGIEQGKSYRISYTISEYVSGNIKAICSTSVSGAVRSTNGTYTEILVPSSTGGNFGFQPSTLNFTGKIRVNYVREVTGTMVSQATAANKPTITRIPRKLGTEKALAANYVVADGGYDNMITGVSASGFTAVAGTTHSRVALNFPTEIGKTYNATFRVAAGVASGTLVVYSRDSANGAGGTINSMSSLSAGAYYSVQFVATSVSSSLLWVSSVVAQGFAIDSVSVKEVLEWSYALSFDGTNDSLAAPVSVIGANLSQPYTMIAWGKIGATGIARTMAGDGLRGVGISSLGRARAIHNGPGVKDGSTTLVQGQSVVIESTWDGATTSVYLNGSLEVSSAFSAPSGAVSPTAIGQFGAASSYWNESIGGCVVAPAVMTEAQRKAVRNFAAFELGLTLP